MLELAVVLCIVAVLAAVSIPAFRAYVLRTQRADARAALLSLGAAEEKHFLRCGAYATIDESAATTCDPNVIWFPEWSPNGHYRIEVTKADEVTWTATAVAVDGQADDRSCKEFRLTAEGQRTALRSDGSENGPECWNR